MNPYPFSGIFFLRFQSSFLTLYFPFLTFGFFPLMFPLSNKAEFFFKTINAFARPTGGAEWFKDRIRHKIDSK